MDGSAESVLTMDGIDPIKMIERARKLLDPHRTTERQMVDVVLEQMSAEHVDYDTGHHGP